MTEMIPIKLTQDEVKSLAVDILKEAKSQGASSAEIGIGMNKGFSVTARQGDVESVDYHRDKIIDITVFFGKRMGSASLSDFRSSAIQDAVKAACNIARFTDEDPCTGLADKDLLAFNYTPPDIYYPWPVTVEEAIATAVQCEEKALSMDKRIIHSEGVTVTTSEAWSVYANSFGFVGDYPATRHEISCVLIAKEREDMQRDYSYTTSCDPKLLDPIHQIAKEAAERTINRLGAKKLSTRKVPVIFAAEEARSLLGHFVAAISGSQIYRKASFLVDRLGQTIFPTSITINEQPFIPKGLGSAPFDDDGVATCPNFFIKDGILTSYSLGVYSARKLGLKTTGNSGGVHNLCITTGNKNLAELLKTMHKGLLVTELMGNGTNLLTGDYSQGAAGFWVDHGTIQYPVHEITIASTLQDIYSGLVEVGNDIDFRGNIRTGSILIDHMMVAGH